MFKAPPALPNELVDAIISYVADKETLRNCALVHRDLLPASRHALLGCVFLTAPAAWDSFVGGVIHSEEMRPWLASIQRLSFIDPLVHTHYTDDKCTPVGPISAWRAQYIVPILASRLPNLPSLFLCVDWARCQPHPTTFGSFSLFTSLRQLQLSDCSFPSFCTFRRLLVSLPALKNLDCQGVHWPYAPQPYIVALPSSRPALESFGVCFSCRSCTFALLEWLIHTPTSSTLIAIEISPNFPEVQPNHPIIDPTKNLDYYAKIFAPGIRKAHLKSDIEESPCFIDLSHFAALEWLHIDIGSIDWSRTADMLQALPSRLETLHIQVREDGATHDNDLIMEEKDQFKAMKLDGLNLLDHALSRDNFKDLSYLSICIWGYEDALSPLREGTIKSIQQKLPTSYKRKMLHIQLDFQYLTPHSSFSKCSESMEPFA
uniref:WtsE n=1 Tax=Ganoderma boninense TaxID=34458 RepID=A0A5K1JVK3_9APHY|nr:WtsE [Ganoderma boninense]